MILVDTSVWVRFFDLDSDLSPLCRQAIRAASYDQFIATGAQVLIEFWAVASRLKSVNGLGLTPQEVQGLIADIRLLSLLLPEPSNMADRWLSLAQRYSPVGKLCHDLRLVALAEANSVRRILTLNVADFHRFTEIEVVHPQGV